MSGETALAAIATVVAQRYELERLCGQMLATLSLPQNKDHKIGELDGEIAKWRAEYLKYAS